MMNALDEYDVRASFTALDTDIEGSLCLQDFYTLYLATGFTPVRIPISNLQQEVQAIAGGPVDRISLDLCLEVLSQASYTGLKNLWVEFVYMQTYCSSHTVLLSSHRYVSTQHSTLAIPVKTSWRFSFSSWMKETRAI